MSSSGPGTLDFTSSGFNIFEDTPTGDTVASDRLNTNPLIGPLQDNGGLTFTRALLPNSPAIDAGVVTPDALITPTTVSSSTSADDLYPAGQLIDGSGLSQALTVQNVAETTHSVSGSSSSWVTTDPNGGSGDYFDSGSPGPDPVLTFNLPEVSLLTDIAFWGYDLLGFRNGAKTISVAVSTDGGTTFGDAGTVTLQIPTANAEILPMPGGPQQANAVRLTITDNHYESGQPGGDRVGLAEVRFLGFSAGAFDQRGPGFDRVVDGDDDGTATIDIGAFEFEPAVLSFNITETSISENGGTGTATVSRTGPTSTELIVTLASDDTSEATVPATVTIPAGQSTSAPFNIAAVDDAVADGPQTVTITAAAAAHGDGTDTLVVTDDETASLTLTISAASIAEGDGATATTATVSRDGDTSSALTVTLTSSDTSEATVPATITIPAGQTASAAFNIAAVDDAVVDGTVTVTVTASAAGVNGGTDTVDVTDDETAGLTVTISAASISENGGQTTATVSRNGDTTAALTVTLASDDTSEATVPATVTIDAGQTTSSAFTITAVDDSILDGTQTVTISASATGLTGGSDTVDVTDDEVAPVSVQVIRSDATQKSVPAGGIIEIPVLYQTLDANGNPAALQANLISFNLHFDSDVLSFVETVQLFTESIQVVPSLDRPENDPLVTGDDNDAATQSVLVASYSDNDTQVFPGWPNNPTVGPQTLFVARFMATQALTQTSINFSVNTSGTVHGGTTTFDFESESVVVRKVSLPGDVDGNNVFDANDSFLIHLVKLSGTDFQIEQSRGSSPLTATEIRQRVNNLSTLADVDGDGDFDANDSFLIHLVKLAGTDTQIDQSKGGSSLSAAQIRASVTALGASSSSSTASVRAGRRLLPPAPLPANIQTVDNNQLFSGTGEAELREVQAATEMADSDELVTVWKQFRQWIDIL